MPTRKVFIFVGLLLLIVVFVLYKNLTTKKIVGRVYTNEKITESTGQLSSDFPKIPVYPQLKLDKSYKREQDGKNDYVAYWYYDGSDEQIPVIIKWYVDELKNAGWEVEGPLFDEAEKELYVNAQNNNHILRFYNSERYEGDEAGPAGKIFVVDIIEK